MDDIDTTIPCQGPAGDGQRLPSDDFDAFVLARAASLFGLARRLLRDPGHAEDVVQDVLAKAFQHWDRILQHEAPEPYVRRMVINACTSFWRRPMRREVVLAAETMSLAVDHRQRTPDASGAVDDRELVLSLLRKLPPRQRAVLVLRHYEGLHDAEIAELLGCSPQTVRSNVHRGLASLRVHLEASRRTPAVRTVAPRREVRPCVRTAVAV